MKKRLLALSALIALSVTGCSSSTSPDSWKTLDDIAAGIREAGGSCDPVDTDDGAQGTCGDDSGYYMISINSKEHPDVAYAQRYAVETEDTDTPIVTLWEGDWVITCIHNAEANCAAIKEYVGDVSEYTTQPTKDVTNARSDADLEAAGRQACIEALNKANESSGNMPTIAHDPQAKFTLSKAKGHEMSGSMSWTATISTSAGIPWEHRAKCIADVSTTPPTVTYLSADVPGLN